MISAKLRRPALSALDPFRRLAIQRAENAALIASDRGAREVQTRIRTAMASAGLGRLGKALGYGSDLKRGKGVHRRGAEDFSASGWVYIRSPDERTVGTIVSYTEGAEITPKKGRYLWIATKEIPARVGRYRMTPERYVKSGLENRLGPLVMVRSVNGRPLLVIKNVGVPVVGGGRAKSLKKNGQPRKGQRLKEFVVAFIGIPRTSRKARVDPRAIAREVMREMPNYTAEAFGKL